MLIDQRKKTLEATKHYNNSYNYLLNVYPELKKGKVELNRKKLQKKVFPNEEDYSLDHNEESIKKLLNKNNNVLTSDEYSCFASLFDCEPMILFKNIDEINYFEQEILKECFSKFKYFIHDLCHLKKNVDVLTLKRALMRDHNHFYFEPIQSAIQFTRLFCAQLLEFEKHSSKKVSVDIKLLNRYLDMVLNFLKKNIYPIFRTFGRYSFKFIRNNCDHDKIENYVSQSLVGLDDWSKRTILENLFARGGKSARLVLDDGIPSYDESIEKSEKDIREAQLIENSGMYLTKYLGRYRRYQRLSLYSNKLNKGAEIAAVNNWIDFFNLMKQLVLLHSANFKDKDHENDTLDENCSSFLSYIFVYKIECCNVITTYDRQHKILNMIDNTSTAILPAILQEYIKIANNSVSNELFIGELL